MGSLMTMIMMNAHMHKTHFEMYSCWSSHRGRKLQTLKMDLKKLEDLNNLDGLLIFPKFRPAESLKRKVPKNYDYSDDSKKNDFDDDTHQFLPQLASLEVFSTKENERTEHRGTQLVIRLSSSHRA